MARPIPKADSKKLSAEAIKLRQAGVSLEDIAEQVGASRSTVSRWVADVSTQRRQRATSEAIELRQAGTPMAEIAERLGCSEAAVYYRMRSATQPKPDHRVRLRAEAVALRDAGLSYRAIGRQLNASMYSVREWALQARPDAKPKRKPVKRKTVNLRRFADDVEQALSAFAVDERYAVAIASTAVARASLR